MTFPGSQSPELTPTGQTVESEFSYLWWPTLLPSYYLFLFRNSFFPNNLFFFTEGLVCHSSHFRFLPVLGELLSEIRWRLCQQQNPPSSMYTFLNKAQPSPAGAALLGMLDQAWFDNRFALFAGIQPFLSIYRCLVPEALKIPKSEAPQVPSI